ncbi:MAG: TadE/TadG family type IV pilus assembly protein [Pseudomonadota bacterium]
MRGSKRSWMGRRVLKALSRDKRGVTAVEFALLAPVFFAMILSLFEIGILFTRIAMVDHAVNVVSKLVYTGKVTEGVAAGTYSQSDIEAAVCDVTGVVIPNCESEITVELTEIAALSSLPESDAACQDSTVELTPTVSFSPGAANSVVFMRVCLTVDLMTPGLGFGLKLTKTSNDRYELISSVAFLNEPF